VLGTENARRGWRVRPHKVRIRCGRPLTFPRVEEPSKALAGAVAERIWPCVMLQWEWLGGLPPLRRATVIGAGAWGTSLALMLERAGLEVELGCRTREQSELLRATRENARYLPHQRLPDAIAVAHAPELQLGAQDLVCFAVPARALAAAVAEHGGAIPARAGVVVLSKGLAPPLGSLPAAYVSERVSARAVAVLAGPSHGADALANGAAPLIAASLDGAFVRQLADALAPAGFEVQCSSDVTGVELAGVLNEAHLGSPAIDGPAALIDGRIDADTWSETVTSPPRRAHNVRAA
ncbi:MAG TPA: 2-dehydropantoate 2-reductase N-terminal domain-containing protein, partial [Solirubrobacteraceae bacterium]